MTLKSLKCHRYQYGYTSLYIRLCILFENILIFINEIFFYLLLFQSSGLSRLSSRTGRISLGTAQRKQGSVFVHAIGLICVTVSANSMLSSKNTCEMERVPCCPITYILIPSKRNLFSSLLYVKHRCI